MPVLLIPLALVATSIVASISFAAGAWWSTRRHDDWQEAYPYVGQPMLSADQYDRLTARMQAKPCDWRTLTADDILRQVRAL